MRDKRRGGCQTPASLTVQTNLLKQQGAPLKSNLALVALIVASFWWGWLRRSFYLCAWAPAKAMMRYDYAETLKVQLVNLGRAWWNISPRALKVKPLKRWRRVERIITRVYTKSPNRLLFSYLTLHFGHLSNVYLWRLLMRFPDRCSGFRSTSMFPLTDLDSKFLAMLI